MLNAVNQQKPERQLSNPDTLQLHHIWDTMQGEGPHAGRPAVFVRLTGCNIQCPACDTEYTNQRQLLSPAEIVDKVVAIRRSGLVVLTGGEPFRQDITKLVVLLLGEGFEVQIESNGTVYRDLPFEREKLMVVCSPKTSRVDPRLAKKVAAWKFILDADHVSPNDGLPTRTMHGPGYVARPPDGNRVPIYVQPLDVGDDQENDRHLKAAVKTCMTYGYRLCLQMHKLIGLE